MCRNIDLCRSEFVRGKGLLHRLQAWMCSIARQYSRWEITFQPILYPSDPDPHDETRSLWRPYLSHQFKSIIIISELPVNAVLMNPAGGSFSYDQGRDLFAFRRAWYWLAKMWAVCCAPRWVEQNIKVGFDVECRWIKPKILSSVRWKIGGSTRYLTSCQTENRSPYPPAGIHNNIFPISQDGILLQTKE